MKKNEFELLVRDELKKVLREEFDVDSQPVDDDAPNSEESEPSSDSEQPEIGEESGEGDETKTDLEYIAKTAQGCVDKVNATELEGWVQSHIAAAKELIASAAEYLGYSENEEETEDKPEEETEDDSSEVDTGEEAEPTEPTEELNEEDSKTVAVKEKEFLLAKKKDIDDKLKKMPESKISRTDTNTIIRIMEYLRSKKDTKSMNEVIGALQKRISKK